MVNAEHPGSSATKTCPYCSENILATAIRCKHCQADLRPAPTGDNGVGGRELLGSLALLAPLIATLLIWFWIGQMNLLQGPASSLSVLGLLTILVTALLSAMEAKQLGAGGVSDLDKKRRKRSGPTAWFFAVLLMWIFGFPAWLYQRKHYGLKNLVTGGILVALLFVGSWVTMAGALEVRQAEVGRALGGLSTFGTQELGQDPAAALPVVTRREYEQVNDGQTYEEVTAIIGQPGREISSSDLAGMRTVMYSWSNADGSNMNAMFQDGKLVTRAQFGLK